jgi:hypothetical protein
MSTSKRGRLTDGRTKESQKAQRFLEELSWLLDNYSTLDLKTLAATLQAHGGGATATAAVGEYASANPNKQFLVGALPRVFTDESLFPTNEDIAQFAESVMDLRILRYGKKSKYEIIGHIVCETDRLDDRKLAKLVSALAALADGDDRTKRLIRQRKEQHFEWNAIIQELAQAQNG